jgi:hypothetical protein
MPATGRWGWPKTLSLLTFNLELPQHPWTGEVSSEQGLSMIACAETLSVSHGLGPEVTILQSMWRAQRITEAAGEDDVVMKWCIPIRYRYKRIPRFRHGYIYSFCCNSSFRHIWGMEADA